MRHVIESQQFDVHLLRSLFTEANLLETNHDLSLRGKIMASLFYEESTRTRFSFESAMLRLGGGTISTENAKEFSSAAKGETLEDTIRVVSNYVDVIVLRHWELNASERAARVASVPVINAGSGAGQHPTQALLDLYTIQREVGHIDGLTITIAGDLKYGRTVRSLAYLLGKYKDVRIHFVSPPELRVGWDIRAYLDRHMVTYSESDRLDTMLGESDVLYQTRIQRERFTDLEEYDRLKDIYFVDMKMASLLPEHGIIMHPLPRNFEIAKEVDELRSAAYFRQTRYGLLMRMALLRWVMN